MQAPPPADGTTLPFTLGHENAGWVKTPGPGVAGFAPGEAVIVYGPWGCGLCVAHRGDHRRRRRHRRRQAGDRQAHGRRRGAAFGRPGGDAHQGHDAGSGC
ncbi:alcohol dehydrogenase catalytic domain-containing protein [Streptomyces sp. NPDC029006]|uniref:alcohol dehydrogenase catalytic domain-containing protein n=1 Tax=Streptomyces sp. NPDC029006 TaxID=3155467 RepID=UPI0033EF5C74